MGAFAQIEQFKLLGICDVNSQAPGLVLARQLGIPAFEDIAELMQQPGLEVIVEATGVEKVRQIAVNLKPDNAVMVDSTAANVMMTFMESHEAVLKRTRSKKLAFQTSAPFLTQTYGRDGVLYFTSDTDRYDFVQNHNLSIEGIHVGAPLVAGGSIEKCIKSRQPVTSALPRSVYGVRLHLWVVPLFEDDDESMPVVGTYGVFTPQMHPVEKAFEIFAPIIIESQPEGAWACVTDHEKIVARMGSDKFDLKHIQMGTYMLDNPVISRAMREVRKVQTDTNDDIYGHLRTLGIPLVDEESKEAVGVFGLTVPRNLAFELTDMAGKLNIATGEMAAVMEEIAASAGEINHTGMKLSESIQAVKDNAASIAEITVFTKSVAEQTKMLGLNAAIEAARAGEHGRGFGVVAEEIRKLSDESKKTADQITQQIKEIEDKVQDAVTVSAATLKQSEEQAAATQQVTASVSDLANMADQLTLRAKGL